MPLQWAVTQMNLGNVLSRLGARESGTGRLEEAVLAYREALKERTRARRSIGPLRSTISPRFIAPYSPRTTSHLDDALETADGGLEEFRKANAAFYIDKAERRRGEILAMKNKAVSRR